MENIREITEKEAQDILSLYKNKVVSNARRGAGTALLIDVGILSITIEWSWRFESEKNIILGSFSEESELDKIPNFLSGLAIKNIVFFGRLPEISIEFYQGYWLSSFSTVDGDPEWAIKYKDSNYMFFKNGKYVAEVNT